MSGLPQGLKFRKTAPSIWRGNGFGTASASYEAVYRDKVIGRWADNGGTSLLNGNRVIAGGRYRIWRERVIEHVVQQQQEGRS